MKLEKGVAFWRGPRGTAPLNKGPTWSCACGGLTIRTSIRFLHTFLPVSETAEEK